MDVFILLSVFSELVGVVCLIMWALTAKNSQPEFKRNVGALGLVLVLLPIIINLLFGAFK